MRVRARAGVGLARSKRGSLFFLTGSFLVAAITPTLSFAAGDPQQCLQAYEASQVKRRDGALLAARIELQKCSRAECQTAIRTDCITWLDEVQKAIPAITLRARDGDEDVFDVEVRLDGVKIKDKLDGKPIELDPGTHEFTFVRVGKPSVQVKAMVVPGAQTVEGRWDKPRPVQPPGLGAAPPPIMERPVPLVAYGLLGLGIVGAAGFAYFGTEGKKDKQDLADSCAPFCGKSEVDSVNRKFLIADISGGVGVAAIVAAGIVYLARPEISPQPSKATGFKVVPGFGSFSVGWRGDF